MQNEDHALREAARRAHDTLIELNPNNYTHDDVCEANAAVIEAVLTLADVLGETHGKTAEWWADRRAALSATLTPAPTEEVERLRSLAKANNNYARLLESERHQQLRWFAGKVVSVGQDLPSHEGWAGVYGLAVQLLDLIETDCTKSAPTAAPIDNEALVEEVKQAILAQGCGDDYTVGDAARAVLALPSIATCKPSLQVQSALVEEAIGALEWYAEQFCEYGSSDDGCGKYGDDICSGCKARATLAKLKEGRA